MLGSRVKPPCPCSWSSSPLIPYPYETSVCTSPHSRAWRRGSPRACADAVHADGAGLVGRARPIDRRPRRSVRPRRDRSDARGARGRRPGVERVEGGWPRGDGVRGGRARSDHRHRHGGDRAAPGVGGDSGACGRRRLADRRREGHDRLPRERSSSAGPRRLLQGPRPRRAVLRGSDHRGQRLGGDRRCRRLRSNSAPSTISRTGT